MLCADLVLFSTKNSTSADTLLKALPPHTHHHGNCADGVRRAVKRPRALQGGGSKLLLFQNRIGYIFISGYKKRICLNEARQSALSTSGAWAVGGHGGARGGDTRRPAASSLPLLLHCFVLGQVTYKGENSSSQVIVYLKYQRS